MHRLSGKHLNNYHLLKWIGSGNHGDVYEAENMFNASIVALKVLKIDPEWNEERQSLYFKTFHKEALMMRELHHSNLVMFQDFDYANGFYFLVQNYIAGKNLHKHLKQASFSLAFVFLLMFQLCWGLEYLHQKQILHLDLKPANLILQPNGVLKITDYGSAHFFHTKEEQKDIITNTLKYSSPEQITRATPFDPRTDLFALGILFYEFLYQQHPFPAETQSKLIHQICQEPIHFPPFPPSLTVSPRSHSQNFIHALNALIAQLLHKEKEKRPPSVRATLEALWQIQNQREWIPADFQTKISIKNEG